MAIPVFDLRTQAMRLRHKKLGGYHPVRSCELCRKLVKPSSSKEVAIDHERYEFVTDDEARERGDAVSMFLVGADCYRTIRNALSRATHTPTA